MFSTSRRAQRSGPTLLSPPMHGRHCIRWVFPLFLLGCGGGLFPGYRQLAPDLHVRLHALGDGERQPTDSDSVLVRFRCAHPGGAPGSLYSTEAWFGSLTDLLPGEAVEALKLRAGDSASVILRGARFPADAPGQPRFSTDTAWIGVEVSLLRIRSHAESRRMAWERLMARDARDEERILSTYLAGSNEEWTERMGVRCTDITGNGALIASGQQVMLHYRARFLDTGKVFDDTWRGGQPLTFKLGDPGQVIKGLEVAVHLLPDGGRGRFIIPSALAFGPQGSSSGIVPPYTPLLYEVEARVVPAPPAS